MPTTSNTRQTRARAPGERLGTTSGSLVFDTLYDFDTMTYDTMLQLHLLTADAHPSPRRSVLSSVNSGTS